MYVHAFFLVLCTLAGLVLGAVLMRSAMRARGRRGASALAQTAATLDRTRLQLVEAKAERDDLRRRLQEATAARQTSVRDLIPARMTAIDTESQGSAFCRLAFRSHVMFANECPVVLSFRDIVTAPVGDAERLAMLCELYARAIFECAFARLFDGADPCTDVVVLEQVTDAMGAQTAYDVHLLVKTRGVVLREPPTIDGNGAAAPKVEA